MNKYQKEVNKVAKELQYVFGWKYKRCKTMAKFMIEQSNDKEYLSRIGFKYKE